MIRVSHLNKIFHENRPNAFHALHDISLHVTQGELLILKGISGSGKSTLLSILGGLSRPSSGAVEIEGENIVKLPDLHLSHFRASYLGFVFQSFQLFEELSVADNVAIPLLNHALSHNEIEAKCIQAMRHAAISHKSAQEVRLLSGGEKQRCAIARALVNTPRIILCDEPTANLDRHNARQFLQMLQQLHAEGTTIIVATHDPLFDSLQHARTLTIESGRILNP